MAADLVFLCYRRDDSNEMTGRFYDRVCKHVGRGRVFRDVRSIPAGKRFDSVIQEAVARTHTMFVIIGDRWDVTRLHEGDDSVRQEIALALKHGVQVIPVLIRNANMPARQTLPESIHDLAFRNGLKLRDDPDFDSDVERLLDFVPGRTQWWLPSVMFAALASTSLVAAHFLGAPDDTRFGAVIAHCPAEMVEVPAGTFWMGTAAGDWDENEHPARQVTLSRFCIDRTEVTVGAYVQCARDGRCPPVPTTVNYDAWNEQQAVEWSQYCTGRHPEQPLQPINCVDWNLADRYCSEQHKRLPTEAEWELAARGFESRLYPWGDAPPSARLLNAYGAEANVGKPTNLQAPPMYAGDDHWPATAAVGSFPLGASPFGALDMAGNVWEWTADWYAIYNGDTQRNPTGPSSGRSKVYRGGAWMTRLASQVRTANRGEYKPSLRSPYVGFRCAL